MTFFGLEPIVSQDTQKFEGLPIHQISIELLYCSQNKAPSPQKLRTIINDATNAYHCLINGVARPNTDYNFTFIQNTQRHTYTRYHEFLEYCKIDGTTDAVLETLNYSLNEESGKFIIGTTELESIFLVYTPKTALHEDVRKSIWVASTNELFDSLQKKYCCINLEYSNGKKWITEHTKRCWA